MKSVRPAALSALLIGLMVGAVPVIAHPFQQEDAPLTLEVEAGFDGYAKTSAWLPVYVRAVGPRAVDGELRLVLAEETTARYLAPVSLTPGAPREWMIYAPPTEGPVTVEWVSDGRVLATAQSALRPLSAQDRLVLTLGEPPDAFNFLADLSTPFNGRSYVARIAPARFPDHSAALNSVDVVVLSGVDTTA
ncbi:MAG: hypothetical protein RMN25_13145, partial [Anaerolineae bacterium]|nr:hypothetical protein [Thermoflexales bacterium]MDW8408719.1 hypothetical protein [Anaerolineae bacterium]